MGRWEVKITEFNSAVYRQSPEALAGLRTDATRLLSVRAFYNNMEKVGTELMATRFASLEDARIARERLSRWIGNAASALGLDNTILSILDNHEMDESYSQFAGLRLTIESDGNTHRVVMAIVFDKLDETPTGHSVEPASRILVLGGTDKSEISILARDLYFRRKHALGALAISERSRGGGFALRTALADLEDLLYYSEQQAGDTAVCLRTIAHASMDALRSATATPVGNSADLCLSAITAVLGQGRIVTVGVQTPSSAGAGRELSGVHGRIVGVYAAHDTCDPVLVVKRNVSSEDRHIHFSDIDRFDF